MGRASQGGTGAFPSAWDSLCLLHRCSVQLKFDVLNSLILIHSCVLDIWPSHARPAFHRRMHSRCTGPGRMGVQIISGISVLQAASSGHLCRPPFTWFLLGTRNRPGGGSSGAKRTDPGAADPLCLVTLTPRTATSRKGPLTWPPPCWGSQMRYSRGQSHICALRAHRTGQGSWGVRGTCSCWGVG